MNKENVGLYDQSFEHDNCGIGAVVNIKGLKTYKTVDDALKIVEQLEHRAGKDAAGETGDGVGILTQIPDEYFQKNIKYFTLPQKGEKKALAMMVRKNAMEYLNKFSHLNKQKYEKSIGALTQLTELLKLETMPKRIEAYDISNIQAIHINFL